MSKATIKYIVISLLATLLILLGAKHWDAIRVAMARGDVAKADAYLSQADNQLKLIGSARLKDPTKLLYQEQMAIEHMTKAKDAGIDIEAQVATLCEMLSRQHNVFASGEVMLPDNYAKIAKEMTEYNLERAMSW